MMCASPVHLMPVCDEELMTLYHIVDRMVCPSLARCLKVCPVTKVSRQMCL